MYRQRKLSKVTLPERCMSPTKRRKRQSIPVRALFATKSDLHASQKVLSSESDSPIELQKVSIRIFMLFFGAQIISNWPSFHFSKPQKFSCPSGRFDGQAVKVLERCFCKCVTQAPLGCWAHIRVPAVDILGLVSQHSSDSLVPRPLSSTPLSIILIHTTKMSYKKATSTCWETWSADARSKGAKSQRKRSKRKL